MPSMEREEWCSECAVREGSRYTTALRRAHEIQLETDLHLKRKHTKEDTLLLLTLLFISDVVQVIIL